MKTFVYDYHLNDPTTLLHYQIPVYNVHVQYLASGYKNAFAVLHLQGVVIFHNCAYLRILRRSPVECLKTEMSECAMQQQ